MPSSPYRAPPEPPDDEHETPAAAALVILALLLGVLIALFAPRSRSNDPDPRGQAIHHPGGHGHGGGHR
jgi:Spy/CpxP family protein refolding chaperone